MKVYLIRHAQSEENILNLRNRTTVRVFNAMLHRSPEALLTEAGRIQALALVERMAGERIDRLYTSPFLRALTTATTIGEAFGLMPEIVDDLREVMPHPLLESRRSASMRRLWIQSYLAMIRARNGGESWAAAYRRAKAAWARLTAEQSGTIAAVSHRALIWLILLSLRRDRRWRIVTRDLSNGGISLIVSRNHP